MKRPILGITIISIIAITLVAGYFLIERGSREILAGKGPQPVLIETGRPALRDFRLSAKWIGRVESRYLVKVVALEGGRVTSVDTADETVVKKGALLFTMGGPGINSRLAYLKEKVASLRWRLSISEARVKRKRQAVKQRFSSRDELETAEDALARIQTDLSKTRHDLQLLKDLIRIRAPIHGVFTRRTVTAGQEVEKGMILGYITDPLHLRIVATLFPGSAVSLQGKTAITHTVEGRKITGKITRVLPEYSLAGGTIVWIEGSEVNRRLKTGETLSGEVILKTKRAAIAIPQSAIVYDRDQRQYIFVKHGKGYKKQEVHTGLKSGNWLEVISGVTGNDKVVTKGAYELFYRNFNKTYRVPD
ncbi:MAG TPA: efflux RND transporter periplasmic adaptor subunit [Nitrospirae bacterium]|nr:efflux RND transporter periplasmic adaptor subunit [Nitrospirota bacterium]